MQPVNWRSRTTALGLSLVFSALLVFLSRSLLPRGGHDYLRGILCIFGMYAGAFAFIVSVVRLAAHGVRWHRAGRPRSPF